MASYRATGEHATNILAAMLQLTAEARKSLRPRRSIAGSAEALDAKGAVRLAQKLAKTYRTAKYGGRLQSEIYAKGIELTSGKLAGARAAAQAFLTREPDAKQPLAHVVAADLEVLAIAEKMLERVTGDVHLLPLIAHARSAVDAITVALRTDQLQLFSKGSWTQAVYVDEALSDVQSGTRPRPALRNLVCALDDAAYARARAFVAARRAELDLPRRARLAWASPDERWGGEDWASWPAATPGARRGNDASFLFSTTPTAELVRRVANAHAIARQAVDLVCALPEADAIAVLGAALPEVLKKPGYGPLLKTPPREIATALACLVSPAAAAELAKWADHPLLAPIVLAYFADHPELGGALRAAASTSGKSKLAKATARALGDDAKHAKPTKVAKSSAVPSVLVDRPWRKKLAREVVVVAGLAMLDPKKVGAPAPHVVRQPPIPEPPPNVRPMTKQEHAAWRTAVLEKSFAYVDFMHHREPAGGFSYLEVPTGDALWAWNEHTAHARDVEGIFARFGLAALPGFARRNWVKWLDYEEGPLYLDLATRFVAPGIAPALARAAQRAKGRRRALAWFRENALIGALGLVPDAVGEPGDPRSDAEDVLAYLAERSESAAIRKAAKAYGAKALAVVEALLARDPLALGAGTPKLPSFLRPKRLPPVLANGGGALPDDAVAALVEMLQVSALDPPYAGLALVRDACTAASLGDLALELFEQWVTADAPGRQDWMLNAILHFPSEASARRLATLAREWARKNQAKAIRACHALGALATDFALLHLAHIAETTRYDALRTEAASALEAAAAARGLTSDELGDRTVGDWTSLDEDGTLKLDFGKRTFVVTLDEQLAPIVRDAGGTVQKGLPRATKDDDAKKAAVAKEKWDTLRADLEQLADRQLKRLERAMVTGRSWSAADFAERLAGHRLLRHLARRLVWIADGGKGTATAFRVAEDGTLADARDRAWKLPAKATVRLAHPAVDELDAWSKLFADYELLQPFPQLGRGVPELTAKERAGKELQRTAGVKVAATKVLGMLEARGWRRSSPGHVTSYVWALRGDVELVLPVSPGFEISNLKHAGEQTTGALRANARVSELDPVALTEALRDADALRG